MPEHPTCLADIPYGKPVSQTKITAALGMDPRTFRKHLDAGDIAYVKIGGGRRFLREDAEAFLENQRRMEVAPCPSTNRKTRRSTTTTSGLNVIDFTDRRASGPNAAPNR